MQIYLARHGQDEDNVNGILNGHRNKPLTDLGIKQAQEVALKIKEEGIHFDVVYTSPLIRATKTAEIITGIAGAPYPVVHNCLTERDFGVMTGVEVSKIKVMCAPDIIETDIITYFLHPEGAETFDDLINRAKKLLRDLNEKYTNQTILLVCHGDIGKMIYAAYYGLSWKDVLMQFHFGNSELLLLSENSSSTDAHVFSIEQYNH